MIYDPGLILLEISYNSYIRFRRLGRSYVCLPQVIVPKKTLFVFTRFILASPVCMFVSIYQCDFCSVKFRKHFSIKIIIYLLKMKRWLVFGRYRPKNISTIFQNIFSFFLNILKMTWPILMKFNILIKYLGDHKKNII